MGTSQRFGSNAVEQAEAVLVEQYPHLVRLAYVTLPDTLGRHSRVLLAHRAVQRSLPRARAGGEAGLPARAPAGPGGSTGPGGPLGEVRARVLRAALAPGGRTGAVLVRFGWPPAPPFVWGLRLWPPAGGVDETARLLGGAPAAVRAAFVLHRMDGLAEEAVARVLAAAGSPDPADSVREALALPVGETLSRTAEFDACVVNTRPTDLLRRRRRVRAAWAAAAVLALVAGVVVADGAQPGPPGPAVRPAGGSVAAGALDPDRLVRIPAAAWSDTARVDFTAWPARGSRAGDLALLARALGAWAAPSPQVAVTAAPGTPPDPPGRPPQLLYAGDVDGRAVVVLLDADRVARYGEAAGGPRDRALEFARTDEAGVTTAGALAVSRGDGRARYLLAPWIAAAATRDLARPAEGSRPLAVAPDGLTGATAVPGVSGPCDAWPVLELTSSSRIVEKHSFLLTDLGALSPVHLTYTPLPDGPNAVPARQPREATGPAARAAWAPVACRLRELSGGGVRAVNIWDFADTELPEGGGRAVWSCTRASGWAGPGDVLVQLRPPAGPPQDVARARSTAACGRFGQHLLVGTRWRSAAGHWYELAAGSREVAAITATGAVSAQAAGRGLVAPAGPAGAPVTLTARLTSGAPLTAPGGPPGPRRTGRDMIGAPVP
ncbi:hypothetical protein [Streptomyces sp. G-G2]|uniref:hypothetical protein n=1 Tax=Streptomyces sp. G-G2 TaxID=3046201 RepID=UPI0024B9B1AC|nr:hypothetical protein [Streptomyces sp. G-G2]MDJ0382697.1 hypothetical protein [Streptomyces sp. G-G2]